jgi:hypothetical protein
LNLKIIKPMSDSRVWAWLPDPNHLDLAWLPDPGIELKKYIVTIKKKKREKIEFLLKE